MLIMSIKNYTQGFTLIELLVVIAIIGVLTAVVTAQFNQAKMRSRDAKRVSDIAQLQLVFEAYYDRCGAYPKFGLTGSSNRSINLNSSVAVTSSNGNPNCPTGVTLGSFISRLPQPPVANESYTYVFNPVDAPSDYHLSAVLESSTSSAFNDDADFDSTAWGTGGINGLDSNRIYDVRPR